MRPRSAKPEIAALIPHAGAMCLLDSVRSLGQHVDRLPEPPATAQADHPLASDGRLDAICGIEYAAQAMAVHGGLTCGPAAGRRLSGERARCDLPRRHGSICCRTISR